jgi:carbonic anhydrase
MDQDQHFTRRGLLAGLGSVGLSSLAVAAEVETAPANSDEAVERLTEGNRRFVTGKTRHAHASADWRLHLVGGQQPFATILGCSDSRVPVELVFDQGFGDLFVIRVAGNVIAPEIVGTIEYAVTHLKTQLLVVLGHERCGAVTAAVQALDRPPQELPGLDALIKLIEPGVPQAVPGVSAAARISTAVEANVRWSMQQLAQLPEAKKALEAEHIKIAGAVYELTSGRVRWVKDS